MLVSVISCGTVKVCVPFCAPVIPSLNAEPPFEALNANGCDDPVVFLNM